MTEIDERIVAMHFDNKEFEKGAKETIKTLEQLKESMEFEGATEGINEFAEAISDLDLSDVSGQAEKAGKALESVGKVLKGIFSFGTAPLRSLGSAFSSLASQVKQWFGIDIAHDIEQAAKKMVKSLTVEPVSAGWSEYEMKMDSIKTIMAGTKKEFAALSDDEHMGKVKDVLEQLNKYADDTIYSFKDMTSSIGKFTNAGVHLDVAAKSMMGISNLAAQAGQGTQQASMAMYNFSQSMGLGYVELRDWRSIENANMATLEFKETLIDVGLAMGTLKKNSKGAIETAVKGEKAVTVTAENVRETLNKKWLTSDVLSKTLEIYSGELTEKELKSLGNFTDEQVAQFMSIGAEAKKAATQVRTFSKMYDALKEAAQSGWAISFEKIIGDMNEATEFWTMINDRVSGWLSNSADERNGLLNQWRGLASDGSFRLSEIDGRQELILALQNIFDIVEKISQSVKGAVSDVFGEITGEQLRNWSVNFREFTDKMSAWLGSMDDGESRISKISRTIKGLLAPIKAIYKVVKPVVGILLKVAEALLDPLLDLGALLGDLATSIVDGKFSEIPKAFDNFTKSVGTWFKFDKLKTAFSGIGDNLRKAVTDMFNVDGEASPIASWFQGVFESIGEVFTKVKTFLHWDEFTSWASNIWNEIHEHFFGKRVAWNYVTGKAVYERSGFSAITTTLADDWNNAVSDFKKAIHWEEGTNLLTWIFGEEKIDRLTGEKVRAKSGLQQTLDTIIAAFTNFFTNVSSWSKWEEFEDFITKNIYQPIVDFCSRKEDGSPSQLKETFDSIVANVSAFTASVTSWIGWETFGNFFTNSIYQPIVDFCSRKEDGSPSQLKETFDSIVAKVTEFWAEVTKWTGWNDIWTFLNDNIIQPITKFYNWLVHGDENYGQNNGKKAAFPLGVIASGTASDVNLLKRDTPETKKTLDGIAEAMTDGFSKITGSTNVFDQKDGEESPFQKVMSWFESLGGRITSAWDTVSGAVNTVATEVSSAVDKVKEAIDKVIAFVTTEDWEKDFGILSEKLSTFGTSLLTLNTGLSAGKMVGGTGTFLGGLGNLFNAFSKDKGTASFKFDFGVPTEGLNSLLKNVGESVKKEGIGKTIGEVVKSAKEGKNQADASSTQLVQSYANLLIEFAGSVALLSYAFDSLLTSIERIESIEDPEKKQAIWDRFNTIATGIVTSLGVTELVGLASSVLGHQKVNSVGTALIGFAGAVEGLVLAITQLADLSSSGKNLDGALSIMGELAKIIGEFAIFTNISAELGMGPVDIKAATGQGKVSGLIGFTIALASLVIEVKNLAEMGATLDGGFQDAIDILDKLSDIITKFVETANLTTSKASIGFDSDWEGAFKMFGGMDSRIAQKMREGSKSTTLGASASLGANKSAGLFGFMFAMWIMLVQVENLANLTQDEADRATGAMEAVGGIITRFVEVANLTTSDASLSFGVFDLSVGAGANKSAGLLGFIAGMWLLINQMIKLSEHDPKKLDAAADVIERLGNMMSRFVSTKNLGSLFSADLNVGTFHYNGGKSTGIIGFILAINELLIATALIADGDIGKMKQAELLVERVGNMVTAFTGVFDLTSGIGSVGQRITALLAIVSFAGALWLIMQQVTEFAKMDETQFQNADRMMTRVEGLITAMAATLIGSDGIMAAIILIKDIDAKTIALGAVKVLEAFGIIFGASGLVAWLLGFLDESVISQMEQGVKVAGAAGSLIGEFVHGLVAPFIEKQDTTDDIDRMATKLADIDEDEMNHAIAIMGKVRDFGDSLRGFNPSIFQQWFSGDITLGQFAGYMTELAGGLEALGRPLGEGTLENATLAVGMLESVANLATAVKDAGNDGIFALDNWLMYVATDPILTDNGPVRGINALSGAFTELGKAVSEGLEIGGATITADTVIDKIVLAIENGSTRIRDAVAAAISSGMSGINLTGDGAPSSKKEEGNPIIQPLTDGVSESVEELESRFGGVLNLAGDTLGDAGGQTVDMFLNAVERVINGESTEAVLTDLVGGVGDLVTDSAASFGAKAGETMGFNFGGSIKDTTDNVYDSAAQVPNAAANAINDNAYRPIYSVTRMATSMVTAFNTTLSIHSPSKEFYDSTGYILDAIVLRLSEHQGVLEAIGTIGTEMMLAWQLALNPIDTFIQSKMNMDPKISPVLDMSSARSVMNGFTNGRYSLNSTVPSLSRNFQAPNVNESRQNGSQIVAAINERIDQLNANIANLKLYLDTGAFVGATVGAYDRALGFRAARAVRG